MMIAVPPAAGNTPSVGGYEKQFADAVTAETKGRLRITVYPPGQLPYKLQDTLTAVGNNSVQIGDGAAFIASSSNVDALLQMPFLITSATQFQAVLPKVTPDLKADFAKFGDTLLYSYTWPEQTFWGTGSPIASFKDLAGRKVRGSTPQQNYLLDKLGATSVGLTTPEVAPALERGTVSVVTTAAFNLLGSGWQSLIKWGYMSPVNMTPGFIVVNTQALQALPADLRATLLKVAGQYQDIMLKSIPQAEKDFRQRATSEYSVKLVPASAGDSALGLSIMKPYITSWAHDHNVDGVLAKVQLVPASSGSS
jgi:TRAP-type C4-dicarboxylate transport system substrate-binding protein